MTAKITNSLDAVEMSRRLREQTGVRLAAMTQAERMALLNAHIGAKPTAKRRSARA